MIRTSILLCAILLFFLGGVVLGTVISDAKSIVEERQLVGQDLYKFSTPQYFKDHVFVKIVTYPTFAHLALAAKIQGFDNWQAVRAFAVQDPSLLGPCTVHIVDPSVSYHPDYAGHEILHCFYGNWHQNAGNMNQQTNVQ